MSQLYQCDKCKKQTTDPRVAYIRYQRTPEEIEQLAASNDLPAGSTLEGQRARKDLMAYSAVDKTLELCDGCFAEFKFQYA